MMSSGHPSTQSWSPSLARQGLDWLLASCPHLELVRAEWQPDGPWLLVTLGQRSVSPSMVESFARHPYAIWKHTGAVHGMQDGAVTDDPLHVP